MSIEAMKQALEALELANYQICDYCGTTLEEIEEAITALRQAIEQAQKQEPVADIEDDGFNAHFRKRINVYADEHPALLVRQLAKRLRKEWNTTPPQRQPLTDEQKEILNFLLGASDIEGVWYGDKHPQKKGAFWWRDDLRKAFQQGAKENGPTGQNGAVSSSVEPNVTWKPEELYTPPPRKPEQEPVTLPCCGYTDTSAIKWNPFNRVVQCHNCGQTYALHQAIEQAQKEPSQLAGFDVVIDESMPPNKFKFEQAQKQEPVVWMYQDKSTHEVRFQKNMSAFVDHSKTSEIPLYGEPLANHELQCVCGAVWCGDEMVHLPNKTPSPPQRQPLVWQPIETAPKDGTDILVMNVNIETQIVHNAFWIGVNDTDDESDIGWWSYEHSEVSRIKLDDWMEPTHWLPLPIIAAHGIGEKNG